MITREWRFDAHDPLLQEHRLFGKVVVPFAAWLVRCYAALSAHEINPRTFTNVTVRRFTPLTPGESLTVDFTGTPAGITTGRFQVRQRHADSTTPNLVDGSWESLAVDEPSPAGTNPRESCEKQDFYRRAAAAGWNYGPMLRRIEQIRFDQQCWAAKLTAMAAGSNHITQQTAVWDAMLQSGSVLATTGAACWVPYQIDRIHFRADPRDLAQLPTLVRGLWVGDSADSNGRRMADIFGLPENSAAPSVEFRGVHYALLRGLHEEPATAVDPPVTTQNPTPSTRSASPLGPKQILARLRAASADERRELLRQFVEDELLTVLQWDRRRSGDLARGLAEIGLDSVMAVELQFRLQSALKLAFKPSQPLPLRSVHELVRFLLDQLPASD